MNEMKGMMKKKKRRREEEKERRREEEKRSRARKIRGVREILNQNVPNMPSISAASPSCLSYRDT